MQFDEINLAILQMFEFFSHSLYQTYFLPAYSQASFPLPAHTYIYLLLKLSSEIHIKGNIFMLKKEKKNYHASGS